jgi:branched-chain amino acid transport system ATP-binding protein
MRLPIADQALLRIENLRAVYNGAVVALTRVDFDVRAGEIVALLGSNGAGKTTTLRAISNLLPGARGDADADVARFAGRDIARLSPGDLVRDGFVPVLEGRRIFGALTVEENLIAGAIGASKGRRRTAMNLERIYSYFPKLAERRRSLAGLASGGEQQMLAIGRALMAEPRLLSLDEPSMGLAPLIVQDIFRTLRRLNQDEGLAILVAEQNSAVALAYAHRAVVLENGVSAHEEDAATLRSRDFMKDFYLGRAHRAA